MKHAFVKISTVVVALSASAAIAGTGTPVVSSCTMQQGPGNRIVTIKYAFEDNTVPAVVTLDVKTNVTGSVTANESDWVSIGGEHLWNAQGAVWRKVTSADIGGDGKFTITWDPTQTWKDDEGNGFKVNASRVDVTAWPFDNTPDYMVVDLTASGGPDTQRYYSSTNFLPGGLLANEDYRKNLLVMRKIMAKDVRWTMGNLGNTGASAGHVVQLTNNYYIGVFEFTQSQWAKVATNSVTAAYYTADKLMRPMERVTFNELRNTHRTSAMTATVEANDNALTAGAGGVWPDAPTSDSFLGLLRLKTGLDFDLPSDAEWEFACRAGNGEQKWNNGLPYSVSSSADVNLSLLARYRRGNPAAGDSKSTTLAPTEGGTAICGSYAPNSWGLYDMHGNVGELCLDFYSSDPSVLAALQGKVNTTTATTRVRRGGALNGEYYDCYSSTKASADSRGIRYFQGFRVVCRAGLD